MSEHSDDDVRCAVARNANCGSELLARLGDDHAATVRLLVSRHDRCPPELKNQISEGLEHQKPSDLASVVNLDGELYDLKRNRLLGG